MFSFSDLLQTIINGIMTGTLYSLIGMGLNCIYSVMKIINFCQSDLLMIGAFVAYFSFTGLGIDPYLSIPLVLVVLVVFAVAIQHFLVTPMIKKQANNSVNMIFLTVGLGMLFQNLAQIFFKSDPRIVKLPYAQTLMLGEITISLPKLISFAIAVVLTILVFSFFKRSKMGKMIRATSQNRTGAMVVGIKADTVNLFAFGLGACLAGITGAIIVSFYSVTPTMGMIFGTRAFAVIMLGGLGNIKGAFIAGMLVGILENVWALIFSSATQDTIVCITFLIVLIARQKYRDAKAR